MTKKLLCLVCAVWLLLLCGCAPSDEQSSHQHESDTVTYTIGGLTIVELYDANGDIIQKTERNQSTNVTIISNYTWFRDGWGKVCSNITIVTVNPDGTIISSTDNAGS